jgi:hypothetical protein
MAIWKKVVTSGSAAQLSSLRVDTVVSASTFSGSFVGNGSGLTGIVPVSASYAATASVGGGIYGSSGTIPSGVIATLSSGGTFGIDYSTGANSISITDAGALVFAAKSANYGLDLLNTELSLYGAAGGFLIDSAATLFTDSLGTPLGIQYAGNYGTTIRSNDRSIPDVGTIRTYLSASYAKTSSYYDGAGTFHTYHTQSSAATVWTFTHNLGYRYPTVTVYDSMSRVVIPQVVESTDVNTIQITFPSAQSGYASAAVGSIFPVVVASSATSASYAATASLVTSASYAGTALSASYALTSSFAATASRAVSSSFSSTAVSASFVPLIFSRGATIADVTNGFSTTGSYAVWRAPYTCTVTALYGRAAGSTTAQVNARKSGSAGYSMHTASNLVLGTANTWIPANSVQNTSYTVGDSLEIVISGSGATQVAVQVDFIRT